MPSASVVVVSPARGVRQRVVGVVDLLELLGAGLALGRVRGDAVRVVLEGALFVGVADLLLRGGWADFEQGVVVGERGVCRCFG
jgi:hypothetical protein